MRRWSDDGGCTRDGRTEWLPILIRDNERPSEELSFSFIKLKAETVHLTSVLSLLASEVQSRNLR